MKMDKFTLAKDCIVQDKIDFQAVLRALERYKLTNDEHYINVINGTCNVAITTITKLLSELKTGE